MTLWNNSSTSANAFSIGADTLTVDLSSYAVSGASSLTLVDYANAGVLTTTFASDTITGTGGWGSLTLGADPFGDASNLEKGQYFIDYSTGSNITLLLHVPEPSSTALLGLGALAPCCCAGRGADACGQWRDESSSGELIAALRLLKRGTG